MTAAYDLFQRELHAQGRERLDGFSTGNFARLTAQERSLVRQALVDLLDRRDMRAPVPLAVLDSNADTIQQLQILRAAQLGSRPADLADFDLQVLVALAMLDAASAGVLDGLEAIMRDASDNWKRGMAMDGLRWAQPASDASARLGRLVLATQDEDIRADCADTLLQRHGWYLTDPSTQVEALQLLRALVDGDEAQRQAALLKVLKAPIKPWPQ
jgi:hypothetical protein